MVLKTIPRRGEFWQPITGGLEEGETKIDALKREVREETGIENVIKIVENVHYYRVRDASLIKYFERHGQVHTHVKNYVFGVEVSSDKKVVLDEKEHSEFKWCTFQETLRLMKYKGYRDALRKLDRILSHI